MNHTRRSFVTLGAIGGGSFLFGCATPDLMPVTKTLYKNETYKERVSSVLVSADDKTVVVMTDNYHYVFAASSDFISALKASYHHCVAADLGLLHIDSAGIAKIEYSLLIGDRKCSPEELTAAASAGFKRSASKPDEAVMRGTLVGVRYAANGVKPPANSPLLLNKSYEVTVDAELSPGGAAARALVTPLAVAADGAIVLVTVAASIVLLPLAVLFGIATAY